MSSGLAALGLLLRFGKYTHVSDEQGISKPVYGNDMPKDRKQKMIELLGTVADLLACESESAYFPQFHADGLRYTYCVGDDAFDPMLHEGVGPIVAAKLELLDMCLCFFDYRMNARMHTVFKTFGSRIDAHESLQDEQLDGVMAEVFAGGYLSKEFVIDQSCENISYPDNFTCKLLGLTRYNSVELQLKSLSLLVRHRGQKEALAQCMSKACLVYDLELAVIVGSVEREANEVRSLVKWLASAGSPSGLRAIQVCTVLFPKWCSLCTPNVTADYLVGGQPVNIDSDMVCKLKQILRLLRTHEYVAAILGLPQLIADLSEVRLRQMLHEGDTNDDGVIDMAEFEVLCSKLGTTLGKNDLGDRSNFVEVSKRALMDKVRNPGTPDAHFTMDDLSGWFRKDFDEICIRELRKLLPMGYTFLTLLCSENESNQREIAQLVYRDLVFMVSSAGIENLPEIPIFVQALCRDNFFVSTNIKPMVVQALCTRAIEDREQPIGRQWIKTLRHLCSANGVCVERNSSVVADCLLSRYKQSFRSSYIPLTASSSSDELFQAIWHIEFVLLLVAMVEGTSTEKFLNVVHSFVTLGECSARICNEGTLTTVPPHLISGSEIGVRSLKLVNRTGMSSSSMSEKEITRHRQALYDIEGKRLSDGDLEGVISKLFNRYDIENLGMIDDAQSLCMLTVNALVKFRITPQQEVSDACIWFTSTYMWL